MISNFNKIITIVANADGLIFSNNAPDYYLFRNCDNIYQLEELNKHKHLLCNESPNKKFLANLFKINYLVLKLPLNINGINLFQYIFEEWRINTFHLDDKPRIKVDPNNALHDINNYSTIQREIIYSFLSGYFQDKEILNFLSRWNYRAERTIRHNIAVLYEKFETNNRAALVRALKAYKLDMHVPESIFAPGIYNID